MTKRTKTQWQSICEQQNNRCQRAIKPLLMSRKAFLFSKTAQGANASATLYSIAQTAIGNSLVPYDYLLHVMEEIMQGENDPQKLGTLEFDIKLVYFFLRSRHCLRLFKIIKIQAQCVTTFLFQVGRRPFHQPVRKPDLGAMNFPSQKPVD